MLQLVFFLQDTVTIAIRYKECTQKSAHKVSCQTIYIDRKFTAIFCTFIGRRPRYMSVQY